MATKINIGDVWKDIVVAILEETNGSNMRMKVIEIGDWNMNSTATLDVAHGLTITNIRTIQVMIRDDYDSELWELDDHDTTGGQLGYVYLDATNVKMGRAESGKFDTSDYNATSFNRGWITIWYLV